MPRVEAANRIRRLRWSLIALTLVLVAGTVGYWLLGFGWLDAVYQTVTTVTTVGFREVRPLSHTGQIFTIVLILAGVGIALYTVSIAFEALIEGQIRMEQRRRRMDRNIAALNGHVIVCGWGRVGKAIAARLAEAGRIVVVVDQNADRLGDIDHPYVVGDATLDAVLLEAGILRASTLVAAIDTDAENLYVTLSGRSLNPGLFIIARARDESSESKLSRAGADRVVNPQAIGGARIAAFVSQPHVAEFLDVVMHDHEFEFQLAEVEICELSPLAGTTIHNSAIRERTGALILALRTKDGTYVTNPARDTVIDVGHIVICIGTAAELANVAKLGKPV